MEEFLNNRLEQKKPESFLEKVLEKASQSAVLARSKYMNIIKRDIASSTRKEAVMNLKCGCDEYDMNVLVTERDVEKIYEKFVKKCIKCNQPIKISFKF
ncbi:MAG: hypothetical protein M0016_07630 [Deltaproteobacteria bacterium]|jgi:hypothetical protein|nr:hypothetical protein [Deltaproteobacteria bacterium]MCL5879202.1 hypothetical protein [Deltaproteobacteria bacterium]MDA8305016.1 hypothetical protein [Deltaproteobacteria bacterium]